MALYVHILKQAAFGCGDQIVYKKKKISEKLGMNTNKKKCNFQKQRTILHNCYQIWKKKTKNLSFSFAYLSVGMS